ncbi:tyrosine-type recombinase/integrase [Gottfriedia sp. S16(2024)]|uniref:tyrosine-type recombinase/integrase n=1 Tax=Gottfriedia sp. S16(2024) TaxID=3162883 RepID=UPI003D1F7FC8
MSKRKGIFDISALDGVSLGKSSANKASKSTVKGTALTDVKTPIVAPVDDVKIADALKSITRQMEIMGYRERTISDYNLHVNHFAETVGVESLSEIDNDKILDWLSAMDVSNQTKLTRLKCLKAFLTRCLDNGWFKTKFWKTVTVKVDSEVKVGAEEKDVDILLSMLDLTDYVELRDAIAILVMYQCGLRIKTLSLLEEKHIDVERRELRLSGDILKNRKELILPLEEYTAQLLAVLIQQNAVVRREYAKKNNYVFVTMFGDCVINGTNNALQRRLKKYADTYGLKNINPHALRRGFAMRLRNKGADILLISKALGHSDLAVTTKYLGMEKEEVSNELRKFL